MNRKRTKNLNLREANSKTEDREARAPITRKCRRIPTLAKRQRDPTRRVAKTGTSWKTKPQPKTRTRRAKRKTTGSRRRRKEAPLPHPSTRAAAAAKAATKAPTKARRNANTAAAAKDRRIRNTNRDPRRQSHTSRTRISIVDDSKVVMVTLVKINFYVGRKEGRKEGSTLYKCDDKALLEDVPLVLRLGELCTTGQADTLRVTSCS